MFATSPFLERFNILKNKGAVLRCCDILNISTASDRAVGHPMSIDVGPRLRFLRQRHRLSQRDLAKRSGVTNSTISLIEAGKSNPSIGALKRILDGVPIGLAEFFALEPDRPRKPFYRAEELTEIGRGGISYRQVGDNLFGRALQILKERYEPGADTGRVPLVHDGEEGGIIISGRLEVTVDGERKILGPGDAYYFESRRPHRFRAVGPAPCELISACTPPTF
jgi:transcriptional regulator with XRE-family HTH domain